MHDENDFEFGILIKGTNINGQCQDFVNSNLVDIDPEMR